MSFDVHSLEQRQSKNLSLLRPPDVRYDFSVSCSSNMYMICSEGTHLFPQIANPLTNGSRTSPLTGMPPLAAYPATGSQPRQDPEINDIQPALGGNMNAAAPFVVNNNPPILDPTPPVRQPRTGATKMRPSKSSTTPRWCTCSTLHSFSDDFL